MSMPRIVLGHATPKILMDSSKSYSSMLEVVYVRFIQKYISKNIKYYTNNTKKKKTNNNNAINITSKYNIKNYTNNDNNKNNIDNNINTIIVDYYLFNCSNNSLPWFTSKNVYFPPIVLEA
jgi:hypothetical protein